MIKKEALKKTLVKLYQPVKVPIERGIKEVKEYFEKLIFLLLSRMTHRVSAKQA